MSKHSTGFAGSELGAFSAIGRTWKQTGNHTGTHPAIEPGDSGGPFMVRDGDQVFVAGTVAGFALSWNSLSWEAVYTDVFHYKPWILAAVKNPEKSPGGSHHKK